MARQRTQAVSDSSDEDVPEAVSFGSSKIAARSERNAVHSFNTAERQRLKEKNRSIDAKLKARASAGSKKTERKDMNGQDGTKRRREAVEHEETEDDELDGDTAGGSERRELQARMARAMMEAEDEEEEENGEFEGFSAEDEDMDNENGGEEAEEGDEEDEDGDGDGDEGEEDAFPLEDAEMGSEDEEGADDEEGPARSNRNYLPDHLFKSALSTVPSKSTKIVFDDAANPSSPSQQRKRKRRPLSGKDLVVGSRTIRTLSKPGPVASPAIAKALAPPRRVDKFMKSSLNINGNASKSKSKGWSRRPANLGVMKRSGPAANFVRAT
ncbi:hypothetical protein C8Q80DRAFT_1271185 [Daedaleopsis nitida]|nr:hypothetical protein C8Q80DRAFT_1271185 [Daedaleopsis nitida]